MYTDKLEYMYSMEQYGYTTLYFESSLRLISDVDVRVRIFEYTRGDSRPSNNADRSAVRVGSPLPIRHNV